MGDLIILVVVLAALAAILVARAVARRDRGPETWILEEGCFIPGVYSVRLIKRGSTPVLLDSIDVGSLDFDERVQNARMRALDRVTTLEDNDTAKVIERYGKRKRR